MNWNSEGMVLKGYYERRPQFLKPMNCNTIIGRCNIYFKKLFCRAEQSEKPSVVYNIRHTITAICSLIIVQ